MKRLVELVILVVVLSSGCMTTIARDLGGVGPGYRAGAAAQEAEVAANQVRGEWVKQVMDNPSPNLASAVVGERLIPVYKGLMINSSSYPLTITISGRKLGVNIDRIDSGQNLEVSLPAGQYSVQCYRLDRGSLSSRPFNQGTLYVDRSPEDNVVTIGGQAKAVAWFYKVVNNGW
jgi:uncharacterized protein YceK